MSIYKDVENLREELEKDQKDKVKVALFGQPGAGKSSLINKIIGENKAQTGQSTDVTVEALEYEHEDLVLVDLPGYGTSKFPKDRWEQEFQPEQYDLFLCVFSGKFHSADTELFKQLRDRGKVCLFVRNKHDDIWEDGKTLEQLEAEIVADVQKQVGSREVVHFVSCRRGTGLDHLSESIQHALEPSRREKYIRSAKAYTLKHLDAKKESAKRLIYKYAGVAAANGLNPVPGVDISVDLGVILVLFNKLRDSYGLSENKINNLAPTLLPIGKKVLDIATKEGILLLLKRFAGQQASKQISKYIPFVGQAIAATIGFTMTKYAGESYLNDCHELAMKILEEELALKGATVN